MKHKAHVLNTAIMVLVLAAAAAAQSTKIVQLRLDAEQGDAHAQYSLGVMYDTGKGVPQDYVQAHTLINRTGRFTSDYRVCEAPPGLPGGRAVVSNYRETRWPSG